MVVLANSCLYFFYWNAYDPFHLFVYCCFFSFFLRAGGVMFAFVAMQRLIVDHRPSDNSDYSLLK